MEQIYDDIFNINDINIQYINKQHQKYFNEKGLLFAKKCQNVLSSFFYIGANDC